MNSKTLKVLEFLKIKNMLLEETTSTLGEGFAEKIEPSIDDQEIITWQNETAEATAMIIQRGNIPLGGIHDLTYHIKRAEIGSYLYPNQLLEVADTLRAARIKTFIKEMKEEESKYPILKGYIGELYIFKGIEDKIAECILNEEEVSDNASSTLKNIRRQMEAKHSAIRNRLNSILSSSENQKYFQDAIVTIRQDRYVVPVKQEYRTNFRGLVHDQSASGATLFIEPMVIVTLNNELKELKIKENLEIERILRELTALIGEKALEIKKNQSLLAKLDFIFAKGKLAVKMRAIEPKINNNGIVRIKNGRHPLLDPKTVVPTNVWIGNSFCTLVITGPNTGGKTVTLKTIGLLTLMAQSGLHVPADYGTEISVFEQIFADIGDEQSIEQSLSTFSSHMTNIVNIVNNVQNKALVLLDELGAGTDPTEGAALAIAILDYLYHRGTRTIATTHYTELKQYALTTEGVQNASVEFDINTLSPTYRLLIGVPGKSNAFEISKKLGLGQPLIDKAQEFISQEDVAFEDILASIERDKNRAEQERDEAIKLKLIIQQQKKEYEVKLEKLSKQKERILNEAREEAKKVFKNAKGEAEEIIKELQDLMQEQEEKAKNRKIEAARRKLRETMDEIDSSLGIDFDLGTTTNPPQKLKIGDTVVLLNLNQKGNVITSPDDQGNVMVQIGIMKINVNIKNLRLAKEEKGEIQNTGAGRIIKSKAQNVKNSIDLRGQMLEEALINTDKYLDDVYIAGLEQVTVIHGKGTGVLREGIKKLLKKHKHVKKFRDGVYGEGGTGVTIVELK
jgi:DNA mismatch repair protein MutS2